MEENIIIELPIKTYETLEELASSEGLFLDEFIKLCIKDNVKFVYQIDLEI